MSHLIERGRRKEKDAQVVVPTPAEYDKEDDYDFLTSQFCIHVYLIDQS